MSQTSVKTSPQSCTTDDSSSLKNEVTPESVKVTKQQQSSKPALKSDDEEPSIEHQSALNSKTHNQRKSSKMKYSGSFNLSACSASNKLLSSSRPSKKRTYSETENDFPVLSKFTDRKSEGYTDTSSFSISKGFPFQGRKSLPANINRNIDTEILKRRSLTGQIERRGNYPFQISPRTPSNRSFHQSCTTDQTPYSPANAYQRRKRIKTALPYYNSSDLITFKSDMGFIDSHCHLDFLFQRQGYEGSYVDYQKKHKETFPVSYKGCVAIFCNPYSFDKKHLWQHYLEEENVWASFGCHPHNAKDYNDEVEKSLRVALQHHKVRALGEIGLDYSNRNNCMRNLQHEAFRRQLKIALEKNLPLVIHCREAQEDAMAIMKEIVPKDYFIHLHCFTDTWEWASKWMQEFPNLFIGLTNVVTYPTAETVHEVAKKIPLSNLLLETDAPYFVPRPLSKEYPGTRFSHPGMAIHVAAQVAALKGGIPLELVLHHTRKNTKKMYNI